VKGPIAARIEFRLRKLLGAFGIGGSPWCKCQILRSLNDGLSVRVEMEAAALQITRAQLLGSEIRSYNPRILGQKQKIRMERSEWCSDGKHTQTLVQLGRRCTLRSHQALPN